MFLSNLGQPCLRRNTAFALFLSLCLSGSTVSKAVQQPLLLGTENTSLLVRKKRVQNTNVRHVAVARAQEVQK